MIIISILIFIFQPSHAIIKPFNSFSNSPAITISPSIPDISTLKVKEVEKLLNRKLKLKEKIALKILQWKLKKEIKSKKGESKSDLGKTSMILGIIGIGVLLIPYLAIASIPCAILAIVFGNNARKVNRDDRKAKTGVILGWITIGLIILALALIVAILATWSGWGWG